jgi:hypothetical protein
LKATFFLSFFAFFFFEWLVFFCQLVSDFNKRKDWFSQENELNGKPHKKVPKLERDYREQPQQKRVGKKQSLKNPCRRFHVYGT